MLFYIISFNHHNMPLNQLELLTLEPSIQPNMLKRCVLENQLDEALLISTCNRVEWLVVGQSPEQILSWLASETGLSQQSLHQSARISTDLDAVLHLMRVASGLDSMIVGESNIQGQIKQAWQMAMKANTLGVYLHRLLPSVLHAAKQVRSTTQLGRHSDSLSAICNRLIKRVFSTPEQCNRCKHSLWVGRPKHKYLRCFPWWGIRPPTPKMSRPGGL